MREGPAVKKFMIRFNSPVILSFALMSLLALALHVVTNGLTTQTFFSSYHSSLYDPMTYLRFVSHVLGCVSFDEYATLMLPLLLIGPPLEEKYSGVTLAVAIAMTALITGLVNFAVFRGNTLMGPNAVIFMLLVLTSFTDMKKEGIPLTMVLVVVFYLGREIQAGMAVANHAHEFLNVVGGICGVIFGFALNGKKKGS